MDIRRAKEEIKDTIEAYLWKDAYGSYVIPPIRQRPVLLIGPPGVGKTQIMEQISRECGIGLAAYTITHHTRQSAIGLPYIVEKTYCRRTHSVTEYTMSEIVASVYEKMETTGLAEGILFIDEINCVSETLAPTMLQFLQGKTFGNHRIPQGWVIVAAGNPPEYNKSVREFDVVTLDRLKMIHVEPNYEVWKTYAYEQSIHPAIISYLNARTENFCRIETTVDGKLFATPRGWEDLSRLLEVYEKLGKNADREVVGQYIQYPKIAKDFANYLELYHKYQEEYRVEEILEGTIRERLCDHLARAQFDEKLSVIGLLLSKLNAGFRLVMDQGERTEYLMGVLKKIQEKDKALWERLEKGEDPEEAPVRLSQRLCGAREAWKQETERLKASGLITRREDYLRQDVEELLERYEKEMNGAVSQNEGKPDLHPRLEYDAAWEKIQEWFAEERGRYDALLEESGKKLEHAFDFMEAAFGDSQEMVVFVTELNANYYSVTFLQEYECERYYQYNERLLFNRREEDLKERIGKLGRGKSTEV